MSFGVNDRAEVSREDSTDGWRPLMMSNSVLSLAHSSEIAIRSQTNEFVRIGRI